MAPVTKLASILLVLLALGALKITVPALQSTANNVQQNTQKALTQSIKSPEDINNNHVTNYQDAQRGSMFFEANNTNNLYLSPNLTTKANINISGVVARTQLIQTFHNNSENWVNGIYVFPLPENAALDHLQIKIGERIIEGQIKEKLEAKQLFEQAKIAGKKASLVVQQRPNLFSSAVANIGPNESIEVSIEYQQTLSYENNAFELRLPLTVTPRYISPISNQTLSSDLEELQPSYQAPETLDEDISIIIELHAGTTLASITSDFHQIESKNLAHGEYTIQLANHTIANQDFVLRWHPLLTEQAQVAHFQQNVNGDKYGLIMIYPPIEGFNDSKDSHQIKREVIFVLDTSGSMTGSSIEQAKQALLLGLSDLRPTDHFNVIEFNSYAQNLWTQSKPAELSTITTARNFIVNLTANGGTEIANALNLAFTQTKSDNDHLRQIVFITDGSVGNEEDLMQLITEKLHDSRLFTVGIGSAPNSYFMTEAAKMGKGTYTYIGSIEQVKSQMLGLLNKLAHPALTDIQLLLNGSSTNAQSLMEVYPNIIADLYVGEPLVLSYRQYAKSLMDNKDLKLTLFGRYANSSWKNELSLHTKHQQSGLNVLWARQKIAQLSRDQRSVMLTRPNSEQLRQFKQDITQTALEHHLVSQYTSLVAVDITPTKPVSLTAQETKFANQIPKSSKIKFPLSQLPQTATTAQLKILLGMLLIGSALCLLLLRRKSATN